MCTLRNSVAIATSLVALLCASTSHAQETTQDATTTTTTTTPTTAQPAQPAQQPVQSVTVQQPAAQVQQPVATTRTTAAPYVGADTYSERTIERRPNRTLLSTGAGIFVLSYGSSVIAGAVSDRDADKRLFIPLVGPWLDLGQRGCHAANPCGSNEDLAKAMIITSGVVQGAGVLLALGSLVMPESTNVTERTRTAKVMKPELRVAPVSFAAGAGLGAVGRF